ncbi:MAG: Cna B-type protein [Bryobacterales bacterium]|nr:Cna B-type protein [Bryobacterales bacterium]
MRTVLACGKELMARTRVSFFCGVLRHESKPAASAGFTLACLLLLLCMSTGTSAFGQAVYGSIAGTVYDSSGAGVPKATVTITDVKKSINYSTTTNESGNYSQTHLIIGSYRVKVEFAGFKTAVQDNVDLAVDTVTTVDITLQPGDVTQTINVTAETPLLKTERTDVATTLSEKAVTDLPTINRNFTTLLLLTPGAVQFNWNDTSTENPQGGIAVNVNGQHFTGLGYLLDGTDNRDFMYGNMLVVPDLDSVVQAKITSANFDAEFGQAQAGVVTTSTKSGTNAFHGSAFMFRRNNLTQARDPFTQSVPDTNGKLLPRSLWSQFGGSIGGPIIKNKTFFFGDYQGTRAKNGGSQVLRIPTAAERTGDLRALAAASGQDIFDPASGATPADRKQFSGNVIPTARLSQPALNLLGMLPLPNIPGAGPTDPNFSASANDRFNGDVFNIRIDHFQNDSFRLFGRYTFTQFLKAAPGPFGPIVGGPQFSTIGYVGKGESRPQSLAAGFDYTVKSNLLTDFRFGWWRQPINVNPLATGSFAQDAGALGLNFANDPTTLSMPHFGIGGGFAQGGFDFGYSLYNNCNCPLIERMQQFQFVNNWSYIHVNHTFKFGVDFRYLQNLRVPSDSHRSGEVIFQGDNTRGPNGGGLSLASFLLGEVNNFQRYVSNSLDAGERQNRQFFYGQDTWRITPKLTLNYGLRWEIYYPQTVTGARKGGWINIDTGEVMIAGVNGTPRNGFVQNSFKNFAPRLGIAYQVSPKTVVRVGYGRTFDVGTFGSIFGHSVTQNLPVLGIQQLNPANNFESVFNLAQGPPFLDVNTVLDQQPKGPNGNPLLPDKIRSFVYPKKMRLATLDAWNASVQHQITSTLTVEVAYVGNKGTHVFAGEGPDYDFNQPTLVGFADGLSTDQRKPYYQKFGWSQGFRYFGNDADNHYNSLQTKVEKRFSNSYQLLAHYTYSHAKNHESGYYPIDRNVNYGRPEWQRNHVFVAANLYELPFGKGKRFMRNAPRAVDLIAGGWQVNANVILMSGLGFTPSYANCGADEDVGVCRPDLVGSTSVSNRSRNQWYQGATDTLANNGDTSGPWKRPAIGTLGNAGRNTLLGPGWFNTDASFFKNFHVTETFTAQFRAEAFNFFNHVNPGNPDGCVDCGNAGRIFNLAPNAIMRRWQFGLRFDF